jgi:DNA-binding MarR family transcriptional regulator
MTDELQQMIGELSMRVRLFIETAGERQYAQQLKDKDIAILVYLEKKGEVSFSELSSFFRKVSPSTVSNTLKKLYQKKLINRREDPHDLRSNIFSITNKGRQSLAPVIDETTAMSRALAESLQLSAEESNLVAQVVRRATQNFDTWMGFSEDGK